MRACSFPCGLDSGVKLVADAQEKLRALSNASEVSKALRELSGAYGGQDRAMAHACRDLANIIDHGHPWDPGAAVDW